MAWQAKRFVEVDMIRWHQKAQKAQEELESAKLRIERPDPEFAYMKRISKNGALTVMRVRKDNFQAVAVKSDVVKSMGLDPDRLDDYYEFKELQRACIEFFRVAHSRLWQSFHERKISLLIPYYQRRRAVYDDYLSSSEWAAKRQQCYAEHGTTCVDCGEAYATDIHHLHYESLGNEDAIFDLVPLCGDCHAARHSSGNLAASASMPQGSSGRRRVEHPAFGFGTVVETDGEGSRARVKVIFDDEGPKWLVESFAKLKDV